MISYDENIIVKEKKTLLIPLPPVFEKEKEI